MPPRYLNHAGDDLAHAGKLANAGWKAFMKRRGLTPDTKFAQQSKAANERQKKLARLNKPPVLGTLNAGKQYTMNIDLQVLDQRLTEFASEHERTTKSSERSDYTRGYAQALKDVRLRLVPEVANGTDATAGPKAVVVEPERKNSTKKTRN